MNRLESLKRDLEANRKAIRLTYSEYQEKILRAAIASQEKTIAMLEKERG